MRTPPLPVVQAMSAARQALSRLAESGLPAELRVFNLVGAATASQVVTTLVDLGIPDALGRRAADLHDLAAIVGAHPPTLHRLLRTASALGLIRVLGNDRYRLTRAGKVLRTDARPSLVPWVRYMALDSTRRAWAGLTDSVRTGKAAFPRENGVSVWAWFAQHPDEERIFADVMATTADFNGADLAAAYPWPRGGTVCDLAGGVGSLLSHVLQADATLHGVLVDSAGALAHAPDFLAQRGIGDRVRVVPGDLFQPLTVAADVYLLKDVLHDWEDPQCVRILTNIAAGMAATSRLVLVEIVQHQLRPHPLLPLIDLQMLTQTDGGRQRTLAELDALLGQAGLRRSRLIDGPAHSMIEVTQL